MFGWIWYNWNLKQVTSNTDSWENTNKTSGNILDYAISQGREYFPWFTEVRSSNTPIFLFLHGKNGLIYLCVES